MIFIYVSSKGGSAAAQTGVAPMKAPVNKHDPFAAPVKAPMNRHDPFAPRPKATVEERVV